MNQVQPKVTFLQKKGQITLPVKIRELFNLYPGSAVKISAQAGSIVVEPASIHGQEDTNEYLEVLDEIAKQNNTTREKLLDDFAKIRHESAKKVHPQLWLKWQQKSQASLREKNGG